MTPAAFFLPHVSRLLPRTLIGAVQQSAVQPR
jgi:hypothetical protein